MCKFVRETRGNASHLWPFLKVLKERKCCHLHVLPRTDEREI